MSTRRSWILLTSLVIASTLLIPEPAQARGGGGGGGHAAMGGSVGMSVGGGGAFGGGRDFGNAIGGSATVTPGVQSGFPFLGGGAGFMGGFPVVSQPYLLPPPLPAPEQVTGPMQVRVFSSAATPLATATRTTFIDGTPTTVSAPLITEYRWPSRLAKRLPRHAYARIRK